MDSKIEDYEIILKLREHISDIVKKYQNDPEKVLEELVKVTNIEKWKVKEVMSKYSINKILTAKLDRDEIKDRKKQINTNLRNIKQYIRGEYEDARKKI
mgnify:FL=1